MFQDIMKGIDIGGSCRRIGIWVILCLLLIAAFPAKVAKAAGLPNGTQTFDTYTVGASYAISSDGCFILTASPAYTGSLGADTSGAYIYDTTSGGATAYLELAVAGGLGSFQLVDVSLGEYDDGSSNNFTNIYIVGYANDIVVAQTTPYNSLTNTYQAEYPIDVSASFSGKTLNRFRVYFTAEPGTSLSVFSLLDFTIANASSVPLDTTPPTVSVTSTLSGPTNAASIPVTITFSEAVTGFELTDLIVGNGTAGGLAGSGAVYTVNVTPDGDGPVTVDIAAGAARDAADNLSTAAARFSIESDRTAPTGAAISINAGATYTRTASVSLGLSVSGANQMMVSEKADFAGASYETYAAGKSFTLTGGDGTKTVYVKYRDAAGNETAAVSDTIELDTTAPTILVTSTLSGPTNAVTIPVTITFSENVTGFTLADFTLGNGTAGDFAGSGTTYTMNVTPSADGLVTVDIAAGAAQDAAGNNSTAAARFSITSDRTAPTVSVTSTLSGLTNAGTIPVTITFSEAVTGFTLTDLTVGNGTPGSLAGSGTTYTVNVTPSTDGPVTVDIAAGVVQDAAGNNNTAATQFSIESDRTAPAGAAISINTGDTYTRTASVSLTLSAVGASQMMVSERADFAGASYETYAAEKSFTLTGGDGTRTVYVKYRDGVGNETVAVSDTIELDTTAPAVGISSTLSGPTNAASIPLTITFSESVAGFTLTDLAVVNGTAGDLTGSGTTYTVNVTPAGDGPVTVNIAAGAAQDAAGNNSTAAAEFSITSDRTAPTTVISSTLSGPTNAGTIPVTITFSEAVTGFNLTDLTVVNGTAGGLTGSGATYIVNVTPTGDGLVTVDIAAGAVQDAAGNNSTAATQFSIESDRTAPTGAAISINAGDTYTRTTSVSLGLSAVGASQMMVSERADFAGASYETYAAEKSFTLTGGDGTRTVYVKYRDGAGNETAAVSDIIELDTTAPTVGISSTLSGPTNAASIPLTITFSESVAGFTLTDLTVGNGTAGDLTGSGTTYTVNVTPAGDGPVTVDIAAGAAQDAAGNNSTAAAEFSITSDRTAPTVGISSTLSGPTNAVAILVTITFSEAVTDFILTDITVGNGTAGGLTGSGTTYTVNVTPTGDGLVTVDIAAGAVQDAAGNNSIAAAQFSIESDRTAPTGAAISINAGAAYTRIASVSLALSASGASQMMVSERADFTGASYETYAAGKSFTLTGGDGTKTVYVKYRDGAGNETATVSDTIELDTVASTTVISSTLSGPTNAVTIPVTITFSEVVTGFILTDLTVGNGTAENLTGSGTTYTVNVIPDGDGPVTVDIGAGAAQDAAGNTSTAAVQFRITSDRTAPTVEITSTLSGLTNAATIALTITFSEAVTDFTLTDLTVGNGTAGSLAGSGTTYTVNVTPSVDGPVTVDIAAGAAQDAAGNTSTAAGQFSITSDRTAPTGAAISINTGDIYTRTAEVSLGLSALGASQMMVSERADFAGAVYEPYATGKGFTLTGGDGTKTVYIKYRDAAGNETVSVSDSIELDTAAPTAVISSTLSGPTNAGTIPVTITFSEAVTGFTLTDLTVGNGTAGGFAGSGTTYTVNVTPAGAGPVMVDIAAGAAQDAAGNGSTAATGFSIISDRTAPAVSVMSTLSGPTNAATIPITITFSEEVTGFDLTDLIVGNGTVGGLAGSGTTYTVNVTPSVDGPVTADIAAGAAQDAAGNTSTAAVQFSIESDRTAPTGAAISINAGDIYTRTAEVSLGLSASGASQMMVSERADFAGAVYEPYAAGKGFTLTGGDGTRTVYVKYRDAAGNETVAVSDSIELDTAAPTAVISSTLSGSTNAGTIPVTITFSEAVTGFTLTDLTVGNGTAGGLTGSGTTYTVDVTPTGDGLITVDIAGGVVEDAAGNANTVAVQFSITSDCTAPAVGISSTLSGLTNAATIPITITFSEAVTGFELTDLIMGNGTAGGLTGSGTTYTVNVTPSADGPVTVNIGAGAAQDATGNANTAAIQFSITSDRTAPSGAAISINAGDTYTRTALVSLGLSASGANQMMVSERADFAGAVYESYAAGKSFTLTGGNGTKTVYVKYRDAAGNETAAVSDTIELDTTAPTAEITSTLSGLTNQASIPIIITFSEAVTGFELMDLTVGNGTAGGLTGSGTTYTVNVTPTTDGLVTVDIGTGAAQDAAGNASMAAAQFSITSDRIAPVFTDINTSADHTTITIDAGMNESGTVYYMIVPDGSTAPTSAEVMTGLAYDGVSVIANGSQAVSLMPYSFSFSISNLSAGTAYDIYLIASDNASNLMSIPVCLDKLTLYYQITAFDAIEDVDAGYAGSARYADAAAVIAALSGSVSANGNSVSIPVVTWENTDSYNPDQAGSYTFTAVLGTLPAGFSNSAGYTATVEVILINHVYSVTYNKNGGSGTAPVDNRQYHQGETIVLQGAGGLTKSGYSFVGWALSQTSGVINGTTVTMGSSDLILYAVWAANTPQPGTSSEPSSEVEKITVDVKQGDSGDTVSQILIERSTGTDGQKSDKVSYGEQKAVETVSKLKEEGKDTARIEIPDTKGEVSETTVIIPSGSVGILSEGDINLQIDTEEARIDISKETLKDISQNAEDDLYFRLTPLKEQKQKDTAVENALLALSIINGGADSTISVIGNPITIETNMTSSEADITLPLSGLVIPSDPVQREALLQQLAVYIEHSDGEKELVRGELVEFRNGEYGLKFHITKFSVFTLIKTDALLKSSENNITGIISPSKAEIKGTNIKASVANKTSSVTVKVTVSDKAVWELYSDKACTKVVADRKLALKTGTNTAYIKVTAEDGTARIFKLVIERSKSAKAAVTKISVPQNALIKGKTITATVEYETASLTVKASVSSKATWKLYSDKACTKVIAKNKINLKEGTNTVYLKVTAENGTDGNIYTLKIKRKAAPIKYEAHVKLGLIGSKDYAEKVAKLFKQDYAAANVVIAKEGKYYRITMDFTDRETAKKACNDMIKRKYITKYVFTS